MVNHSCFRVYEGQGKAVRWLGRGGSLESFETDACRGGSIGEHPRLKRREVHVMTIIGRSARHRLSIDRAGNFVSREAAQIW